MMRGRRVRRAGRAGPVLAFPAKLGHIGAVRGRMPSAIHTRGAFPAQIWARSRCR